MMYWGRRLGYIAKSKKDTSIKLCQVKLIKASFIGSDINHNCNIYWHIITLSYSIIGLAINLHNILYIVISRNFIARKLNEEVFPDASCDCFFTWNLRSHSSHLGIFLNKTDEDPITEIKRMYVHRMEIVNPLLMVNCYIFIGL